MSKKIKFSEDVHTCSLCFVGDGRLGVVEGDAVCDHVFAQLLVDDVVDLHLYV